MVGTDITVGIRRRTAEIVGLPIKADDRRGDLNPAERGLNDGIRLESKAEIARHDVPVFVFAQAVRSRRYRRDIAQGRRDIKMHHRGQALIFTSNRRLRITLRRRTAQPEERKRDADEAKEDAD